ncbi:hypothetical protein T260_14255 [Geobacillus thermopakistaniensis]|uniref:Uncharacterized protein n=1 Tax=Geobacillus thermopakistaniensis (strain MAS1) TaxID=1408282 RepID=A0A7U9P5H1_GEOTM|nr:hypothetical protein GA8_02910 [Geobacillus sp. A8]ESU71280.1 hypothetical protein T260_14255 [Geobacillus sp. MAS1]
MNKAGHFYSVAPVLFSSVKRLIGKGKKAS